MNRNTFNISFYVQKTRVAKNGEVPVVMCVTVNGQRVVTSINLKVDPRKWNAVIQVVRVGEIETKLNRFGIVGV